MWKERSLTLGLEVLVIFSLLVGPFLPMPVQAAALEQTRSIKPEESPAAPLADCANTITLNDTDPVKSCMIHPGDSVILKEGSFADPETAFLVFRVQSSDGSNAAYTGHVLYSIFWFEMSPSFQSSSVISNSVFDDRAYLFEDLDAVAYRQVKLTFSASFPDDSTLYYAAGSQLRENDNESITINDRPMGSYIEHAESVLEEFTFGYKSDYLIGDPNIGVAWASTDHTTFNTLQGDLDFQVFVDEQDDYWDDATNAYQYHTFSQTEDDGTLIQIINPHNMARLDYSLDTSVQGNQPPTMPYSPAPLHQSEDQSIHSALSWQGGDPDGDSVTYDVYFEADNPFPGDLICNDFVTKTCDPGITLDYETDYYWRVVAYDGQATTLGPVWTFTTAAAPNVPPNQPSAPDPGHQTSGKSIFSTLAWTGGDLNGDALTYDVYFETGDSTPDQLVCDDVNIESCTPGVLDYETRYYWRVVASDGEDTTPGPVWYFTTYAEANHPPNPPTTPSPTDGLGDQSTNTTLSWASGGDADGDPLTFNVYFEAGDSTPETLICSGLTITSCDPGTLATDTHYYWQVAASDGESSTNSQVWDFWTASAPNQAPNAPTSPSPDDGVSGQSIHTTLSWTASDPDGDALTFDVYFEKSDSTPDQLLCDDVPFSSCDPGMLDFSAHYYWKVVASDGQDSTSGIVWDFWTGSDPNNPPNVPGSPSPADGVGNQPINLTLTWSGGDPDGDAVTYDVYFEAVDTSPDLRVCSNLTTTSCNPGLLDYSTHYYWYVEASDGHLESDSPVWDFTTESENDPPSSFGKISPADGAPYQSPSVTFSWGVSTGAYAYWLCVDDIDNDVCDAGWRYVDGEHTYKIWNGLALGTTYYWQVASYNGIDSTPADGAESAFWSFTTSANPPGDFSKLTPSDGASGQSTSPTLTWGASSGATAYYYCFDDTDDMLCDNWINNGNSTSVTLSGLNANWGYNWQVKAVNAQGTETYADGLSYDFSSFVTETFKKLSPSYGTDNLSPPVTLTWETNGGSVRYYYCYGTTTDNCYYRWNGDSTSVTLNSLASNTTYIWQVIGVNELGHPTYANGYEIAYWTFTTAPDPPDAFGKIDPANGVGEQPTTRTLSWQESLDAESYAVCHDTTNDNDCSGWVNIGDHTSLTLYGLSQGTTYYWQVRAVNDDGTTYANGSRSAFWHFTTVFDPPADFGKSGPVDQAQNRPLNLTLSWEGASRAESYAYCVDTSNDNACNTSWVSTGAGVSLNDLTPGTTYYWQVRAVNPGGTRYADGAAVAFWQFTTRPNRAPTQPTSASPADNQIQVSLDADLSWSASDPEGCSLTYDVYFEAEDKTPDQLVCHDITSSVCDLGTLAEDTLYYWQVVASDGELETHGPVWKFSTGDFLVRLFVPIILLAEGNPPPYLPTNPSPTHTSTGVALDVALSWVGGDPEGEDVTYTVYFEAGNPSPVSLLCTDISVTTCDPGNLANETTYYWQVVAEDARGAVRTGPVWVFATNQPPFEPSSPEPADDAVDVSVDIDLLWTGGDPEGDGLTYDVYLAPGDITPDVLVCDDVPVAACDPGALLPDSHYYWQVVAQDDFGAVTTGPVWDFVTLPDNGPPNLPSSPSPEIGAVDVPKTAVLSWTGSDPDAGDTLTYDVYLAVDDSTPDTSVCTDIAETTCDPTSLLSDSHYYWQVVARDNYGAETAGPVWDFYTISAQNMPWGDDFSSDLGWIDESHGEMYRDVVNEWLVWTAARDQTRRYYMPINGQATNIGLRFDFMLAQCGGNGMMYIGLAEDLTWPGDAWPGFDVTGAMVQILCQSVYQVGVWHKYPDGTEDVHSNPNGINYDTGWWNTVEFVISGTNWTLTVYNGSGVQLGQITGTFSDEFSEFNYLWLGMDYIGTTDWMRGYFDNIELWEN
jgi:hypothetical protein